MRGGRARAGVRRGCRRPPLSPRAPPAAPGPAPGGLHPLSPSSSSPSFSSSAGLRSRRRGRLLPGGRAGGSGREKGEKWPRRDVRLRVGFPRCRWGRGVAGAASSCGGAGRGLRATWAGLFLAQPSPQDAGPQSLSSALVPAFRLRGATCGLLLRCSF